MPDYDSRHRPRTAYARISIAEGDGKSFCHRLIDFAFQDLKRTRQGQPTPEALNAYEWLTDDSFAPGTFLWCCHFLDYNPLVVRAEGLPNPCRPGRKGGIAEIHRIWRIPTSQQISAAMQ